MVTRIMAVGPGRLNEAACALSFDQHFNQSINKTYIIAPFSKDFFTGLFSKFNIDLNQIEFILDHELISTASLDKWTIHSWYLQQALKLSLLDQLDYDKFLIQDCDVFPIQKYNLFSDAIPNLRVEEVLLDNHPIRIQQKIYEEHVVKLIGLSRPNNLTFVSEIMPITKEIWNNCKSAIQNNTGLEWHEAVPGIGEFDETKWFSEYELLGFYMKHNIKNIECKNDIHPIINSWQDFNSADWTQTVIVKTGKFRPLKFMSADEAEHIIQYFRSSNFD